MKNLIIIIIIWLVFLLYLMLTDTWKCMLQHTKRKIELFERQYLTMFITALSVIVLTFNFYQKSIELK